jgi:hypothetical protein
MYRFVPIQNYIGFLLIDTIMLAIKYGFIFIYKYKLPSDSIMLILLFILVIISITSDFMNINIDITYLLPLVVMLSRDDHFWNKPIQQWQSFLGEIIVIASLLVPFGYIIYFIAFFGVIHKKAIQGVDNI